MSGHSRQVVRTQTELQSVLPQFDPTRFNVLIPQYIMFSHPTHRMALEVVQLDTQVDEKGNGPEIYMPAGGALYTLHYKAALRFASAVNLRWIDPRIESRERDTDGRVTSVETTVGWEVRRPNGTMKAGRTAGYYRHAEDLKALPPKMMEQRRRFAESHAESNAKTRAIFEAIEGLQRGMRREEWAKPFVLPCVTEDYQDMMREDPTLRRMIVLHGLGMSEAVYGKLLTTTETEAEHVTDHVQPAEIQTPTPAPVHVPMPVTITPDAMDPAQMREHWTAKTADERVKHIEALIAAKGYTPKTPTKPQALAGDDQVRYILMLHNMPAKMEVGKCA